MLTMMMGLALGQAPADVTFAGPCGTRTVTYAGQPAISARVDELTNQKTYPGRTDDGNAVRLTVGNRRGDDLIEYEWIICYDEAETIETITVHDDPPGTEVTAVPADLAREGLPGEERSPVCESVGPFTVTSVPGVVAPSIAERVSDSVAMAQELYAARFGTLPTTGPVRLERIARTSGCGTVGHFSGVYGAGVLSGVTDDGRAIDGSYDLGTKTATLSVDGGALFTVPFARQAFALQTTSVERYTGVLRRAKGTRGTFHGLQMACPED